MLKAVFLIANGLLFVFSSGGAVWNFLVGFRLCGLFFAV